MKSGLPDRVFVRMTVAKYAKHLANWNAVEILSSNSNIVPLSFYFCRTFPNVRYLHSWPLNARGTVTDCLTGWTQGRSLLTAHSSILPFPLGPAVPFTSRRWCLQRLHLSSKMLQPRQRFSYKRHLQLWSLRGHASLASLGESKGQLAHFTILCYLLYVAKSNTVRTGQSLSFYI